MTLEHCISALILRSSRQAASRKRVQCVPETPSCFETVLPHLLSRRAVSADPSMSQTLRMETAETIRKP
jgi:hypothetical protein